MAGDDIDFAALSESIERGLAPSRRRARRLLRSVSLFLSRPQARAQLIVNRRILAALQTLSATKASAEDLEDIRTWLRNHNAQLEHAEDRLDRNQAQLESLQRALEDLREWNHNLARHFDEVAARLDPVETFTAASRAVPDPGAIGLELFSAGPAGEVVGYRDAGPAVGEDEAYVAFEDVFRLSEDVIRERQRPYLALLEGRQPVLDVGCGRGEFLELLREAGIPASGVDLDAGMVSRARQKGLDVRHGDAIAYLEQLADASLGVIFAAQVVEHLPYAQLIAFLRLSAQKLAPGGLLIAETVNPHAPGALKNFWFDLTHQHPVFPEVLLTLCRAIGFPSAYIFHPGGSGDVQRDRDQLGDYALVAERGTGD